MASMVAPRAMPPKPQKRVKSAWQRLWRRGVAKSAKSKKSRAKTAYQRALALYYAITKPLWLKLHPACQFSWLGEGVVCGSRDAVDVHHKKGRGKYLNDRRYLCTLCRTHHNYVEKNRAWAYLHGWLIKRYLPD